MSESKLRPEIEALREVLASLRALLEVSEEFRALRQLDERERGGSPLQSIDGVLVRGRLVRRLGESNRYWRAYVRIEEAIAHLEGNDKLEPSLVGERNTTPPMPVAPGVPPATGPPAAAAKTAPLPLPAPAIAAKPAYDAAKLSGRSAPPASREERPLATSDRASTSGQSRASISPAVPVAPSRAASPSLPAEPDRTVLDRIRLVPGVSEKTDAAADSPSAVRVAIGSGRLTDPLPPAIDDGAAVKSSSAPGDAQTRNASSEIASLAPASNAATRDATAPAKSSRLDELEDELARLVQQRGTARLPGRVTEAGKQEIPDPRLTSLEPDIRADSGADADVEEAEVTIVRLAQPAPDGAIKPSVQSAAPVARRQSSSADQTGGEVGDRSCATEAQRSEPSARPSTRSAEATAGGKDVAAATGSETDAAAADVEEADVEIIVPSRGSGAAGRAGPKPRRDPD